MLQFKFRKTEPEPYLGRLHQVNSQLNKSKQAHHGDLLNETSNILNTSKKVNVQQMCKQLKLLKQKNSSGLDNIWVYLLIDCADLPEVLKRKNSSGLDNMSVYLLMDCAYLPYLTHIINNSLSTGVFPADWKRSKLLPIHENKIV